MTGQAYNRRPSVISGSSSDWYWAFLNPALANGHRLKRTPSNPLCLPENLISKHTLLWPHTMIGPAWASNPDSPITVARQRVLRRYQQRHRGRLAKRCTWVFFSRVLLWVCLFLCQHDTLEPFEILACNFIASLIARTNWTMAACRCTATRVVI